MENDFQIDLDIEEMEKVGLHLGHKRSKTHPKMAPFLGGLKGTLQLIDLTKTKEKFLEALKKIRELYKDGKVILFVGTRFHIKRELESFCPEFNFPYVTNRWIGGLLTNFDEIKKRINFMKELEKLRESEDFQKYTKKERRKIEEQIEKLNKKFGGIRNLEKLPDAIFLFDPKKDYGAVKEAKKKKILKIAICDTDANPEDIEYPIPASNNSILAIRYIISKLKEALK